MLIFHDLLSKDVVIGAFFFAVGVAIPSGLFATFCDEVRMICAERRWKQSQAARALLRSYEYDALALSEDTALDVEWKRFRHRACSSFFIEEDYLKEEDYSI